MLNRFIIRGAGMGKVNLKKIAEEAGVSVSLVSLVLNNKKTRVSDDTRQRIIGIAEKYHYVPNRLASSLKSNQSKIIAIIAPFTPVGFFSELIYYIEKRVIQHGYMAVVLNTFHDPEKERESLALYKSQLFDGMLISAISGVSYDSIYHDMNSAAFPFVFIDRYAEHIDADLVSSDHYRTSYDMTMKAVDKGSKNILFLYREDQNTTTTAALRKKGYEEAMHAAGLETLMESFTVSGDDYHAKTDMIEILNKHEDLDAVYLYSGYYLPSFLEELGNSELNGKPLDFYTVDGVDFNHEWIGIADSMTCLKGHFSTVLQDTKQIAQIATDRLIEKIRNKDKEPDIRQIYVPTIDFEG